MLKKILVCLEGSASAEAATRTSIALARAHKARLTGLAIIDEPDVQAGDPTARSGPVFEREAALLAEARKQAQDTLALFERRCREAAVPARALEAVGRPTDAILAEIDAHDLTVFGKAADFRFETEATNPQAREAILHRAKQPVLLVPEAVEPKLGRIVLIAYDGSSAAKRALKSFAGSGLARSREVHVATVDDNGARAWDMANRAVEMLAAAHIEARPHNVVSALSNVDALFVLANQLGAGLMVMGAFPHSRFKQFFSGSATRGLLEKATMPLYLQH